MARTEQRLGLSPQPRPDDDTAGAPRRGPASKPPDGAALKTPKGEVSNTVGDVLSKAFEMVATPALFGVLGYFVDRRLGTVPLFTLVLSFTVLAYMVWKFIATYNTEMDAAQEGKPWMRGSSHG